MTHYPYSGMIPNLVIDRRIVSNSYDRVIELCAKEYRINISDIFRRSRVRDIIEPRMIASYIMRYDLMMGVAAIGRVFGQDHTTVLHACRTVQNLMDTEEEMERRVMRIQQQL